MAVDTDYLDDLMKSIEPIVYPDGVPDEDREENENGEDPIEVNDQEPVLEPIGATKEDSDPAYEQELAQNIFSQTNLLLVKLLLSKEPQSLIQTWGKFNCHCEPKAKQSIS